MVMTGRLFESELKSHRQKRSTRKRHEATTSFVPCRQNGCNSSGYILGFADRGESYPIPTLTKCACLQDYETSGQ